MATDVRAQHAPAERATVLTLPPPLRAILEAEYPRFSAAEMTRRRAAIDDLLAEFAVEHLVYCGANRFGSAVQWLTGWPVTAEAVGVLMPGNQTRCSFNTSTMYPWRGGWPNRRRSPGAAVHRLPARSASSNVARRGRTGSA